LLEDRMPSTVLVATPPVTAPLVAWLWCRIRKRALVIDCHTGAFHSWKWRWSLALLRFFARRSTVSLTHTNEDEAEVRSWGAPALLLPDDVPRASHASARASAENPRVVVAGSLDGNEPVEAVLAAARLMPEVEVLLTGDTDRVPARVRHTASANATFTGWLPYSTFLGGRRSADEEAVFSTDPHIMNRAAFEAVGLGRPLVLSDLPAVRSRFGDAALFASNDPDAMAAAVRSALAQGQYLAAKSTQLGERLRIQHQQALGRLRMLLEVGPAQRDARVAAAEIAS